MSRTAIEGGSMLVASGTNADTAGFGKVTLLAEAATSVSVLVGETADAVTTSATTTVIDPATGEQADTFPDSGVLSYVGHSRFVKGGTGISILLSEPTHTDEIDLS